MSGESYSVQENVENKVGDPYSLIYYFHDITLLEVPELFGASD